ncbi:hypothetical protein KAR91_75990 [Candidatus Pacearchaeota archaeon]|nr:hypothetical protein [Candidatus Pacearchaeota archaeon]
MKIENTFLFMVIVVLVILPSVGCGVPPERFRVVNKYQYVEISIDQLPGLDEVEGILFANHYHPEMAHIMIVVGNPETVEQIIGREIFSDKIINDPSWLYRLISDFANARRVKRGMASDARAVFITTDRAYMLKIETDEKIVYGPGYESAQLKKDFEELGLDD